MGAAECLTLRSNGRTGTRLFSRKHRRGPPVSLSVRQPFSAQKEAA
jgi:hypothetical protein